MYKLNHENNKHELRHIVVGFTHASSDSEKAEGFLMPIKRTLTIITSGSKVADMNESEVWTRDETTAMSDYFLKNWYEHTKEKYCDGLFILIVVDQNCVCELWQVIGEISLK